MDSPSWNDTLRASLASCVPCLGSPNNNPDSDSEDPVPDSSYAIRRARADELEGLLADSDAHADEGDAAADADAISLHSHLGPRGRRRPPPRTPRHIALFGFSLFGRPPVRLDNTAPDPLHGHAPIPARRPSQNSTADLLAAAARDGAPPESLSDADIERRARRRARKEMRRLAAAVAAQDGAEFEGFPGSGGGAPRIPAPFLPPPPSTQAQEARDAADDDEADLDGLSYARLAPRSGPGAGGSRSSGRSSNSGGSGAGWGPGAGAGYERVGSGAGYERVGPYMQGQASTPFDAVVKPKKKKRSTKSKSSATSSTLASPPPSAGAFERRFEAGALEAAPGTKGEEFGPFADADDFDGTPGGLGFDDAPGFERPFDDASHGFTRDTDFAREALPSPGLSSFTREALPSPGLSSRARGFSFASGASGGGKGGGGAFLAGV
ncbi:hypothetical protein C8R44DRAFT_159900 [Mycena epipterygia]|nr:hypothetical protein C8R44DRAFT_159900 [Mycena epipterygia]